MSDRRHFLESELKNIGLRIKACRVLTGMNQEEFAIKHNFSPASVKSWEFGRAIPRLEGLQKLIDVLLLEGIFIKINWILFGEGTGPSFFLDSSDSSGSDQISSLHFGLDYIEKFKSDCKKAKQNPIISSITDDEMFPYYCRGDVITGVLLDDTSFNNNKTSNMLIPMLVPLSNGNYAPRFVYILPEGIFTSSIKSPYIKKQEVVSIGRIHWHLIF